MKYLFLLLLSITIVACSQPGGVNPNLDIQGHRGARGLYPENSIEGFLRAIDIGVTTLEMDVVVSADSQLVVSHEPFMNPAICNCGTVADTINIFKIPYDSIKQFDCGSKPHKRFKDQKKMNTRKPLLAEVIDSVEAYIKAKGLKPVNYNIETKCLPTGDGIYHPTPAAFAARLLAMVKSKGIQSRTTIQSFDARTLQWLHKQNAPVALALLVEDTKNADSALAALGFTPTIYSPFYELIDKDAVDKLHAKGLKVIPWTVNEDRDIRRVAQMGVDGIISDYPDKAVKLLNKPQ
jgi:glycerophosphoryl diester phosphodiesterase